MYPVLDEMRQATADMKAAKTRGEEIDAWARWCKLFDKKEQQEIDAAKDAKRFEL